MKTAQEFRAGQVANINGAPWVIQKAEFNKSGRLRNTKAPRKTTAIHAERTAGALFPVSHE